MKTAATLVFAALAACVAAAADVAVRGAMAEPAPAAVDVRVATADILNRPTALLNKNNLAMDNNVFVTRSNVLLTQNDRLALSKKVEEALTTSTTDMADPAATAVLTKNVLRAVSAPADDSALMTKASAVVAAKDDLSMLSRTITDFVNSATMEKEQSIQSQTPDSVAVMVGTKDLLRQPTAVINKNKAISDNQVMISRSDVTPTANDQVVLRGAKVADVVAPAAAIDVGTVQSSDEEFEKKKTKKKSGKKEDETVGADEELEKKQMKKKEE